MKILAYEDIFQGPTPRVILLLLIRILLLITFEAASYKSDLSVKSDIQYYPISF